MTSKEIVKIDRTFHLFLFLEDDVGRKWTKADAFSEFLDQMFLQRKENMTKHSRKTEGEFQLIWLAVFGRKPKRNTSNCL